MSRFQRRKSTFAFLAAVNAAGVPAAIYMPFLPSKAALVIAICFAAASAVLMFLHARHGYREAVKDKSLEAEFARAGVLRHSLLVSVFLSTLVGCLGFYSASFLLAGGYTYALGSSASQRFTVSASEWVDGKYGGCYDTRFIEQSRLHQVWRALCLPLKFDAGAGVDVKGKTTFLGTFASRVTRPDS